MTAVTISRQLGSLGSQIAFALSEALNYRMVWRELINQAARKAGAPAAALAAIDDLGLLGICPSPQECAAYRREVESLLNDLAQEGNVVIMGRAGQIILRGRPNILHVRIIAPEDVRAHRISERTGIGIENALAQVMVSDRNRRKYLSQFYKANLEDPLNYHLTINTAFLDVPQATEIIICAVENLQVVTRNS